MAATYSPTSLGRSTIGHGGLNFSVRNGKRWKHPRQYHHKALLRETRGAVTEQHFVCENKLTAMGDFDKKQGSVL